VLTKKSVIYLLRFLICPIYFFSFKIHLWIWWSKQQQQTLTEINSRCRLLVSLTFCVGITSNNSINTFLLSECHTNSCRNENIEGPLAVGVIHLWRQTIEFLTNFQNLNFYRFSKIWISTNFKNLKFNGFLTNQNPTFWLTSFVNDPSRQIKYF